MLLGRGASRYVLPRVQLLPLGLHIQLVNLNVRFYLFSLSILGWLLLLLVCKRKSVGFELSQAGRGRLLIVVLTFGVLPSFVLFSRIEDPKGGGTGRVG